MQNQQPNSNGKTQGHAELILDHERIMWRIIKLCWNYNRTFSYHAHYCAR